MTANNHVNLPQDTCFCEVPVKRQGSVLCQTCLGNLSSTTNLKSKVVKAAVRKAASL